MHALDYRVDFSPQIFANPGGQDEVVCVDAINDMTNVCEGGNVGTATDSSTAVAECCLPPGPMSGAYYDSTSETCTACPSESA